MKQIIILSIAVLTLTGCTDNMKTRIFGGSQVIELEKGQRLVEMTWKNNDIWILTEPMDSAYKPQTKTFYECSDFGILEGEITIVESK